jgi:hypothetical protein
LSKTPIRRNETFLTEFCNFLIPTQREQGDSPSTLIIFTVSMTTSRKPGLIKTFISSYWLGGLWLDFFLPTHRALRRIFATPPPAAGLKLPVRFLYKQFHK